MTTHTVGGNDKMLHKKVTIHNKRHKLWGQSQISLFKKDRADVPMYGPSYDT